MNNKMTLFLTSSPFDGWGGPLTEKNRFVDRLKQKLADAKTALFIASDPTNVGMNVGFSKEIWNSLEKCGICFSQTMILDNATRKEANSMVKQADFIVLAGGHVPTQNRFFHEIHLPALLNGYNGVIMGISAGTMNSAEIVYAQPELEGESEDPDYQRFLQGLGLTDAMILPHYLAYKDAVLDGKRVYEDITYPDSFGRKLYALPDGSYLYKENGLQKICGEAWLICDGELKKINEDGKEIEI